MLIDTAPAMSTARPARTANLGSQREERPAMRAKGTVRLSERPTMLYVGGKLHRQYTTSNHRQPAGHPKGLNTTAPNPAKHSPDHALVAGPSTG